MRQLYLLFLLLTCLIQTSHARPVSYPEGWTLMQLNDADASSFHLHYSPTAKYSIGYKAQFFKDEDWQFHGLQLNYLVKRWNGKGMQANIYFKNALGLAHSDYERFDSETSLAGMTSFAADWETRRYFTSYENHYIHAGDIDEHFMQKARIGIAPYVGKYGDLHTWLMLQVDHSPSDDEEFTFTPLVRFFKAEYLAEIGMSDQGDALFNWVVRF